MPKLWTLEQPSISRPARLARAATARAQQAGTKACGQRYLNPEQGRTRRPRNRHGARPPSIEQQARRAPALPRRLTLATNSPGCKCSFRQAARPTRLGSPPGCVACPGLRARAQRLAFNVEEKATRRGNYESARTTFSSTASSASRSTRRTSPSGWSKPRSSSASSTRASPGRSSTTCSTSRSTARSRSRPPPSASTSTKLGGPGRAGQPQPRALDPPPRLPRRLARSAGQGG